MLSLYFLRTLPPLHALPSDEAKQIWSSVCSRDVLDRAFYFLAGTGSVIWLQFTGYRILT